MHVERIRRALGEWLYHKICRTEEQELLVLLDSVVQNAQGVLLQLETACDLIPPGIQAKEEMRTALRRGEDLLDQLRNNAEIRTRRARAFRKD
jgi:hypothetical protein